MKLKKTETAALAVTLAFVFLTAGYLLGRAYPAGVMLDRSLPAVTVERSGDNAASPDASPSGLTASSTKLAEPTEADVPETAATPAAYNRININTASHAELTDLSGIGDVLAGRIIEFREQNGAFASPEDIMQVSGIGEKIFASIRDYITVG